MTRKILIGVTIPITFSLSTKKKNCGLLNKHFSNIIYKRNDTGLNYKTMMLKNLALARIVNYDRKVRC